jgi:hypothetical protein
MHHDLIKIVIAHVKLNNTQSFNQYMNVTNNSKKKIEVTYKGDLQAKCFL